MLKSYRRKVTTQKNIAALMITIMMAMACLTPLFVIHSNAAIGPDVKADAYCVMNAATGEIICEKNSSLLYYPASITKIVTALVVYEHIDVNTQLDDVITFSHDAVVTNVTSASSTLTPIAKEGEQMTVDDVLHGMIMPSANECSNALAEYISGSNAVFADLMNEKVAQLGLTGTHFTNPSGLDDAQHYTTAYDMTMIMKAAMANPLCKELLECKSYTIKATNMCAARELIAGHSMVYGDYPYEGEIAGKGGLTPAAGRTVVTYVDQGDYQVIVTIMKDQEIRAFFDVQTLLDFTFSYLRGECGEVIWEPADMEVWPRNTADVYEFANECTIKLEVLKKGQIVRCVGTYDKWYQISINGVIGYVLAADMTDGTELESDSNAADDGKNPFYSDISDPDWGNETAQYDNEDVQHESLDLTIVDEASYKPVGNGIMVAVITVMGVGCFGAAGVLLILIVKERKSKDGRK